MGKQKKKKSDNNRMLCLSTLFNLSGSYSDETHSAGPVQVWGVKSEKKKKQREEKLFGRKAQ